MANEKDTLYKDLLEAGVHYGHLRKKWNPKMAPYIFMEKKGIHLIDLNKTIDQLQESAQAMKQIAKSGKKILFIATKKQAREIVANAAKEVNMPYVTERWLGGMLTNFSTIKKSIRKVQTIDKMLEDSGNNINKRERLMMSRQRDKMDKVLGGMAMLNRLPAALFIVDINYEHIALAEAKKLNLTTFGVVDTNSDPNEVDFAIPANDDASKSVNVVTRYLLDAIKEGLSERKENKEELENEGAAEKPTAKEVETKADVKEVDATKATTKRKTISRKPVDKKDSESKKPTVRKPVTKKAESKTDVKEVESKKTTPADKKTVTKKVEEKTEVAEVDTKKTEK